MLIFFNLTNKNGLASVESWRYEFERLIPHQFYTVIVGNKCDKEDDRVISYNEVLEFSLKNSKKKIKKKKDFFFFFYISIRF